MSTSAIKHHVWIISLGDYSKKKFLLDNEHFITYTLPLILQVVGLWGQDYTDTHILYV